MNTSEKESFSYGEAIVFWFGNYTKRNKYAQILINYFKMKWEITLPEHSNQRKTCTQLWTFFFLFNYKYAHLFFRATPSSFPGNDTDLTWIIDERVVKSQWKYQAIGIGVEKRRALKLSFSNFQFPISQIMDYGIWNMECPDHT